MFILETIFSVQLTSFVNSNIVTGRTYYGISSHFDVCLFVKQMCKTRSHAMLYVDVLLVLVSPAVVGTG
jgi:hypothetical protein